MAGLDPAIHVFLVSMYPESKTWIPGTRPGMTELFERPALGQFVKARVGRKSRIRPHIGSSLVARRKISASNSSPLRRHPWRFGDVSATPRELASLRNERTPVSAGPRKAANAIPPSDRSTLK